VETADADRDSGRQERPGKIDGARELVGLHPDQRDQGAAARSADSPNDPVRPDPAVGLVIGIESDGDVRAEQLAALGVLCQAVQGCEGIGGNRRPQPLNGIAVVVVMRRLDQHQMKRIRAVPGHCRLHRGCLTHTCRIAEFPRSRRPPPPETPMISALSP
jgi:hypothetical protein